MSVTEEIRKTLSDPKPLYALAGAGDLAAEKLRDAPTLVAEVAGTVTTLANKIAAEAPERIAKVQAKLGDVPSGLDPRAARDSIRDAVGKTNPQVLRDRAQTIALVQVGKMLEAAGKAVETYDELAERGKAVVERYRGTADGDPAEVTVIVEQVVLEDTEPQAVPADVKVEDAVVEDAAPAAAPVADADAAPPKKAAAPRKRATAPKSAAPKTATSNNAAPKSPKA